MIRPHITPDVLAALVAAVPTRAAKKLDASPRAADTWTWHENGAVDTGTETVTLASREITSAQQVSCTCLLQPRCYHVLAVVTLLPVLAAVPSVAPALPEGTHEISEEQRAIAANAARVAASVLESGLAQLSTLRMGELLRVVHACRLAALPRLEAAALSVYEAARDLRERTPAFRLADAAARVAELLLVAERLQHDVDPSWVGTSRRRYTPVSGLRLAGIVSAPVLRSGFAGVVTYFTDGVHVYSAQELLPGDADRARDAVGAQLRFGEISLSHRKAQRQGLLFARAEVSADLRLGAGKDVVCAVVPHDAALVERLFDEPLEDQLDRAGLVFVRGVVAEHEGQHGLALPTGGALPLVVPIDELRFATRDNLTRLAEAGPPLRLVARVAADGFTLEPLAVSFDDAWHSLAYDKLKKSAVPRGTPASWTPSSVPPVLEPLRRRMLRLVLAGARSVPSAALPELARESHRLRESLLLTGSACLDALVTGIQAPARPWLALHVYLMAVERSMARSAARARSAR